MAKWSEKNILTHTHTHIYQTCSVLNIGGICVDCFNIWSERNERNYCSKCVCTLEVSHYVCRRILKGNKFINSTATRITRPRSTVNENDNNEYEKKKKPPTWKLVSNYRYKMTLMLLFLNAFMHIEINYYVVQRWSETMNGSTVARKRAHE